MSDPLLGISREEVGRRAGGREGEQEEVGRRAGGRGGGRGGEKESRRKWEEKQEGGEGRGGSMGLCFREEKYAGVHFTPPRNFCFSLPKYNKKQTCDCILRILH